MEQRVKVYPPLPLYSGNDVINPSVSPDDQAHFTSMFTDHAVEFIERHRDQSFFVYVPHPMPHVPIFASETFAGSSKKGLYGDVIQEIDASVGKIVETVDRLGLTDDTWIIFTSDNGPWISYGEHAGSTAGLREAKGTTFEGGVRVPCVMRWPGKLPAGTVGTEPFMTIDILPTFAQVIGATLPSHPIDGKNVMPIIAGEEGATSPHEAYFFYYHRGDMESMRSGKWKLHFPHAYRTLNGRPGGKDGKPVRYEQAKTATELYDLEADPKETTDVAEQHPDVVTRLTALADAKRQQIGDRLTKVKGSELREPGRLP